MYVKHKSVISKGEKHGLMFEALCLPNPPINPKENGGGVITITMPEWFAYFLVVVMALHVIKASTDLYIGYLQRKLDKLEDQPND